MSPLDPLLICNQFTCFLKCKDRPATSPAAKSIEYSATIVSYASLSCCWYCAVADCSISHDHPGTSFALSGGWNICRKAESSNPENENIINTLDDTKYLLHDVFFSVINPDGEKFLRTRQPFT